MTIEAYLKFYYGFLYTDGDNRKVTPEEIATALQIASRHIPECLSEDEKLEAQAHYAAYLLGTLIKNKISGGGTTVVDREAGPVKAVKEGDSEWQYYDPNKSVEETGSFSGGLFSAFDKYSELASKCLPKLRTLRI